MTKRDAPTGARRALGIDLVSRMSEARRRSLLVGKHHNYGTNPTPKSIRGGLLSLAVAIRECGHFARQPFTSWCKFAAYKRDMRHLLGIERHRLPSKMLY